MATMVLQNMTPQRTASPNPAFAFKSPLGGRTPGFGLFSPNNDEEERARIRAQRAAAKRKSLLPDPEKTKRSQTQVQGNQDKTGLTDDQIADLFQNCIKLAAENKINQKNSWDLPLIDHISEIVKNDVEADSQTNFQKASCTLEAGVKIYSYRVDSVHTEAFKVLGGLNRTAGEQQPDGAETGGENDNEEEDGESEGGKRKESKKASGQSATLETSWDAINVKKFDVAFAVDPLFHQTSAQFDEGGAKGLLLHNLSVYRGCDILFDSEEIPQKILNSVEEMDDSSAVVDLSFMQDKIETMLKQISVQTEISPSLRGILALLDDPRRKAAEAEATARGPSQQEDEFVGQPSPWVAKGRETEPQGFDDDFDDGDFGGEGGDDDFGSPAYEGGFGSNGETFGRDGTYDSQPRGEDDENDLGDGEVMEPEYENGPQPDPSQWLAEGLGLASLPNAWAGPQHWRYRRPKDNLDNEEAVKEKPKRKKREPVFLDFFNIPEDMDLPEQATDLRQINLSKAAMSPANTLLPKDHHYDPVHLGRLFLRPSWGLWDREKRRSKAYQRRKSGVQAPNGSIFTGQDQIGQDELGGGWGGNDASGNDELDGDDGEPMGNGDWEEEDWAGDEGPGDLEDPTWEGLIAQPRKVEKVSVTYARTSKQVDVRALKETLWDGLQDSKSSAPSATQDDEDKSQDDDKEHHEGVSFQELLRRFPQNCKAAALEDISVHLCFICVLHLANEHNLAIHGCSAMDELQVLNVPLKDPELLL